MSGKRVWVVGTDIGGTFTDVIGVNLETGEQRIGKVASTPPTFFDGVINGLARAGMRGEETLSFRHGATVSTNAILERKGVKTALITTEGFRDVLGGGRAERISAFELDWDPPELIVPRRNVLVVRERVSPYGEIVTPLAEEDVQRAARMIKKRGIELVAVVYMDSFMNPVHELRTREILRQELPDIDITLSHEVLPQMLEFERTCTTVLNAYVSPILKNYLKGLADRLKSRLGLRRRHPGDDVRRRCHRHGRGAEASGPHVPFFAGLRRGGTCRLYRLAGRLRKCHCIRNRRHHQQRLDHLSRQAGDHARMENSLERALLPAVGGYRLYRRRRRLDRLGRQGRHSQCRPAEHGRGAGPGLLRRRRHRTDQYRHPDRARPHRSKLLSRRRDSGRRQAVAAGARKQDRPPLRLGRRNLGGQYVHGRHDQSDDGDALADRQPRLGSARFRHRSLWRRRRHVCLRPRPRDRRFDRDRAAIARLCVGLRCHSRRREARIHRAAAQDRSGTRLRQAQRRVRRPGQEGKAKRCCAKACAPTRSRSSVTST